MSFFEPPPPPPAPEPGPPSPEWLGPPDNVWPAEFPLELALARTPLLALFVHAGRAYHHGFEFALALRRRAAVDRRPGFDPIMSWQAARTGAFDDSALRFGIAFGDGRKATVLDPHPWWGDPENRRTPDIVLSDRGGGGGATSWDARFWVWPLPPDGPLEFVIEWPAEAIELTRVALDSQVVRDAAARAETLWPEGYGSGGNGTWTRYA